MIGTTILIAQLIAPGAAQYPSPAPGRHFLDQPVATCVIAVPVSQNAVMLTPCPPATQPPAVSVTPPIAAPPPAAAPKDATVELPREPVVIRIEVVPGPPAVPPAPKAVPKAVPKKKECPCP